MLLTVLHTGKKNHNFVIDRKTTLNRNMLLSVGSLFVWPIVSALAGRRLTVNLESRSPSVISWLVPRLDLSKLGGLVTGWCHKKLCRLEGSKTVNLQHQNPSISFETSYRLFEYCYLYVTALTFNLLSKQWCAVCLLIYFLFFLFFF